jgi:SAM-dependent methyltransferase
MDYDAELRLLNEDLRRSYEIQPHDRVLDVGCGAGATTREAARMATEGGALGVDVSAGAIERARERARAEGIPNVTFERADAETRRFPAERFHVAISRFGTMFFVDPVAAFTNIRNAVRPGGRLVMMVWQEHERNEWSLAIEEALGADRPSSPSEAPDPFTLADPAVTEGVLHSAGFTDVAFIDVRRPISYGPDVAAALEWVRGFTCTSEALASLGPVAADRALARLRDTVASHAGNDGVWFDSRAWIVKARRDW